MERFLSSDSFGSLIGGRHAGLETSLERRLPLWPSERNLSFAAVGDTCNVASRLQSLCRELDADICVGAAVIDNAIAAGDHDAPKGFVNYGPVALRGREELVDVWYVPNPERKAG